MPGAKSGWLSSFTIKETATKTILALRSVVGAIFFPPCFCTQYYLYTDLVLPGCQGGNKGWATAEMYHHARNILE
jgi:hypothetical protein